MSGSLQLNCNNFRLRTVRKQFQKKYSVTEQID